MKSVINTKKPVALVTGGLGFIASSLCEHLLSKGYEVIAVDNFATGKISNIEGFRNHDHFSFSRVDVNNFEALYNVYYFCRPTYVFHYAACVGVQRTLENPTLVLSDIEGIKNVLNLSRDFGVKHVFFSSSSEVYGEPTELPQRESSTPLNARLPYAIVKNLGEAYLKSYQTEFGVTYTIYRFFNTFGPRQSEDFVVSRFIRQALEGRPIKIYGDGSQTRTFCYIADNVEATANGITQEGAQNAIINIGSEQEITILHLARTIRDLCDSVSEIIFESPLTEGDMSRRRPCNKKMLRLMGGKPLVGLDEGLLRTISYFRNGQQE